ncbi:Fic/DOC family protein, partial [Rhodococcus sp. NPDC058514]
QNKLLVNAAQPYGITDPDMLRKAEERASLIRMAELARDPLPGLFDYAHMKDIHRTLFQDVYDWAGQERTGPDRQMTKSGPDVVNFAPGDPRAPMVNYGYYPAQGIAEAANAQFRRLAAEDLLRGHGRQEFIARLADHWGEINTIHSFREGNTRTQFVFFSELAAQAGYKLDTAQFAEGAPLRQEFVGARFYNQATTRTDRLVTVLDKAISEIGRPGSTVANAGYDLDALRAATFGHPRRLRSLRRGEATPTRESEETHNPAALRNRESGYEV